MEWIRFMTTMLNPSQLIRLIGMISFWSKSFAHFVITNYEFYCRSFEHVMVLFELIFTSVWIDLFMAWIVCCVNTVIMIGMILSNSYFLLTRQHNSCLPFVLIIIVLIDIKMFSQLLDSIGYETNWLTMLFLPNPVTIRFECNRSCLPQFAKWMIGYLVRTLLHLVTFSFAISS